MTRRSPERVEFLRDLFITAMEHMGYGQFGVRNYQPDGTEKEIGATITFYDGCEMIECRDDEECKSHSVDLDTMARGLRVIRDAVLRETDRGEMARFNRVSGERLYFDGDARKHLLKADETKGMDGDYDVIGALAALECGMFGRVVYA